MMSSLVDRTPVILIADDDAVLRITAQDYLGDVGLTVRAVDSGRAALEAFASEWIDLVILDVRMPDIDGFSVCEQIRKLGNGRHVPILVITGTDDVESVNRAFEAGATDFYAKPLNFDLLVHRIRYMLRSSKDSTELRSRESSLAYAQQIARLGNWECDLNSDQINCSDGLRSIMKLPSGILNKSSFLDLIHPEDRPLIEQSMHQVLESMASVQTEFRTIDSDGDICVFEQHMEVVEDAGNGVLRLVGAVRDITEKRETEHQIRELAYVDSVTGLPNRTMLGQYLDMAIHSAKRHDRVFGILFIDLDNFKPVNDTWGHDAGDEILREVAERLAECLRDTDVTSRITPSELDSSLTLGSHESSEPLETVARLGGDEFVVVLSEVQSAENAALVAQRINDSLSAPFTVSETKVYLGCSIGVSMFPEDGENVETLLKHADVAMYESKSRGRNGYHFFTDDIQTRVTNRVRLEASLRQAVENQEFILHYQPRLDLATETIVGMEALVRWEHPDQGMISPAEFIPLAEQTGQIVPLGEWVLDTACRQLRQWEDDGVHGLRLSVNFSCAQMRDETVIQKIQRCLGDHLLDAQSLEIELTESLFMEDIEHHLKLVHELSELGVWMSIDDFGTGYSSLRYLKRLPVDTLKIDRTFITDMHSFVEDAAIVKGAISLAHSLNLSVVAEGVETQRHVEMLSDFKCDEVQGFLYAKPMPAKEFEQWARNSLGLQAKQSAQPKSVAKETASRRKLAAAN